MKPSRGLWWAPCSPWGWAGPGFSSEQYNGDGQAERVYSCGKSSLASRRAAVKQEWFRGIFMSLRPLTICGRSGLSTLRKGAPRGRPGTLLHTHNAQDAPLQRVIWHPDVSSSGAEKPWLSIRDPICLPISYPSMSLWLYHLSIFTHLSIIYLYVYLSMSTIHHLSFYRLCIYHLNLSTLICLCLSYHLSTYIITEIMTTSDTQMTPPLRQKAKTN